MRFRYQFVAVLCLLGLPALAVTDPHGPRHPKWLEPQAWSPTALPYTAAESGRAGDLARTLLVNHGGSWSFHRDPATDRPSLVLGSGVPIYPGAGNDLEPAGRASLLDVHGEIDIERIEPDVRSFLEGIPQLLPEQGELELDRKISRSRDGGRLVSLYYQWTVDGVPVDDARVVVRMNSGNITQFGAQGIASIALDTAPAIDRAEALRLLLAYAGHDELGRLVDEPALSIAPEVGPSGKLDYRLVWKMRYDLPDSLELWDGTVDAATGEVLRFVDGRTYLHASGGVYPSTVFESEERKAPFGDMNVTDSTGNATTSLGGRFSVTDAQIDTTMSGRYFDVNCQNCQNPPDPNFSSTIGAGYVDLGFGGVDIVGNGVSTQADRNIFYHAGYARRIAEKWLPTNPWFQTLNFGIRSNISATCNATYDGSNINFYRQGGGCNNTGLVADVVYHEYGHGVDGNTLAGGGGTGEGTADVTSMVISLTSPVGVGFRETGAPVRELDSSLSSLGVHTVSQANAICGGSVHCQGQVFGQSAWDLAQALVARYGFYTGWREAERLFFLSLPDQGSYDPTSANPIYVAYINADDDNGNLADGTPNGAEIFQAFNTHEAATIDYGASPTCTRPAQPALNVVSSCDQFDLDWNDVPGIAGYEIFRTELYAERAYLPVASIAPGTTSWSDSDVQPGIDYHYQIMTVDGAGCESTVESPQLGRLTAQPILSVSAAVVDDTPAGNRSGFADTGEDVDVVLTIENLGEVESTALTGTVVPLSAGVAMLENSPSFDPVASRSSMVGSGTVRFHIDKTVVNCGDVLEFRYDPAEGTGCATDASYFSVQVGEPDGGGGFVCDPTPACFVPATFDGIDTVAPGGSCGETSLTWGGASSNCINAEISYNIYRDVDPAFTPDASNLLAGDLTTTGYMDTLLQPGQSYWYIVRAFDSRSGEETNTIVKGALATTDPDTVAPVFSGLDALDTGAGCGEATLSWSAAGESCSVPVTYEIYRSTDPAFVPSAATRVGTSLTTNFEDAGMTPGVEYTYIVRARDTVGNEGANEVRLTTGAGILDDVRVSEDFEADDALWVVTDPNDAVRGNWEWGNPEESASQPEDDSSEPGDNCWITGAPNQLPDGNNNDIDSGSTTLESFRYNTLDMVDPAVRFDYWYSNAQGAAPGADEFVIEATDDNGANWVELDRINADAQAWVPAEYALGGLLSPSAGVKFRFIASDLGDGSLVDAGIDEFELVDREQGCNLCPDPVAPVGTISVDVVGGDVVIDWSADPVDGTRYIVYALSGPTFGDAVAVGSTTTKSFVHIGARSAAQSFYYRVVAVDACGNLSPL